MGNYLLNNLSNNNKLFFDVNMLYCRFLSSEGRVEAGRVGCYDIGYQMSGSSKCIFTLNAIPSNPLLLYAGI